MHPAPLLQTILQTTTRCAASLALALASTLSHAEDTLPLWPANAPQNHTVTGEERNTSKPDDHSVIRLGNVSHPTLSVFPAPADRNSGAAVLICPGGGYNILAYDLEGTEICQWLNSIGVTGILLKYRVPAPKQGTRHAPPLEDAQRAMGIVRSQAARWKIDPKKIGVLGFSAGGHLSAALSTNWSQRTYPAIDKADQESCRPDFAVLVYPAYLAKDNVVSPELKIDAQTPPSFLVMTADDKLRPETAITYYLALKDAKVPSELHLFPTGGHGYGLRPSEHQVTRWPVLVEAWMSGLGLLPKH